MPEQEQEYTLEILDRMLDGMVLQHDAINGEVPIVSIDSLAGYDHNAQARRRIEQDILRPIYEAAMAKSLKEVEEITTITKFNLGGT